MLSIFKNTRKVDMSDIMIVDDFLTPEDQEMVKGVLFGEQFPWFFRQDITYGADAPEDKRAPAVSHVFRDSCQTLSPFFNQFAPIAHLGASRFGYAYKDILKLRSFMQFPLNPATLPNKVDSLHVDTNLKHLVVLYYVCDSDGDTIIVDHEYVAGEIELGLNASDYPTLQKVTPKQGRAVLFDGKYYHTAEQPTTGMRCVLNFNVI